MPNTITIVVADDHPVVRNGMRALLSEEADMRVIGEARDGAEAVEVVRRLKPHVVLLDLFMPLLSGLEVLEKLQDLPSRFILLTAGNDRSQLVQAVHLHAHGILTKDTSIDRVFRAIRCVAGGEYWIDRELLASAVQRQETGIPFGLTEREIEIVREIASGASNQQIAGKLAISELTVKRHLTNIFEKVSVNSRLELAVFAFSHKLAERQ